MANLVDKQRAFNWPFGRKNYLIFGLGLLSIILGYITLANTAVGPDPSDDSWGQVFLTLSPALLILGYCVLIPIAIIVGGKQDNATDQDE